MILLKKRESFLCFLCSFSDCVQVFILQVESLPSFSGLERQFTLPTRLNFWKMRLEMRLFVLKIFLCCLLLAPLVSLAWPGSNVVTCSGSMPMRRRRNLITITQFGGVGDGRTLNTKAFLEAIYWIQHLGRKGGTLLYIPPGVWLTESFNLTSHMTLFLARDAVLKATQVGTYSFYHENNSN